MQSRREESRRPNASSTRHARRSSGSRWRSATSTVRRCARCAAASACARTSTDWSTTATAHRKRYRSIPAASAGLGSAAPVRSHTVHAGAVSRCAASARQPVAPRGARDGRRARCQTPEGRSSRYARAREGVDRSASGTCRSPACPPACLPADAIALHFCVCVCVCVCGTESGDHQDRGRRAGEQVRLAAEWTDHRSDAACFGDRDRPQGATQVRLHIYLATHMSCLCVAAIG